jgi:hypothetical protein
LVLSVRRTARDGTCTARSAAPRGWAIYPDISDTRQEEGILVMKAKSLKRAFGLAAAAMSTGGMMMLAPTMANAATAHPAHVQTVSTASNVSKAGSDLGYINPGYRHPHRYGYGYRGGYGGYRHPHRYGYGYRGGYRY